MNKITAALGIKFPLIQAGMGGIAGPELAAAVSSAGAGGVVGLYRMKPAMIEAAVRATQSRCTGAYGVNLIPELTGDDRIAEQLDAVVRSSDRRLFFTFYGLPAQEHAQWLHQRNLAFLVMVGSLVDLRVAEQYGAAGVILQGLEAGGHLLGTESVDSLLQQALDSECHVPLLSAGGVGSGGEFRRLNRRGVDGCVCGTLFAATLESRAHRRYKQRLVESQPTHTVVTDIFDVGWPLRRHRVLRNRLTDLGAQLLRKEFIAHMEISGVRHPIPRYSAMVPTSATEGQVDEMAMYCGTSVAGIYGVVSAAECVHRFIDEFMCSN